MSYQQISISSIFFLGLLIYSTYAEEVLIQIVVKKPINIVSDRYVSFSMDPDHLLDLGLRQSNLENATIMARNLGSAYLKINAGTSSNQFTLDDVTIPFNENQVRILPSDWLSLHQWLNQTNLKPIVSLPYTSKQWSPRNIISILGISNRLGVRNCIWQLGSELNSTETIDYIDDLSTLKTIIDVFRKNGSDWRVIGADLSTKCKAEEADLYAELSKHISTANGWIQPTEYNSQEQNDYRFFEKDPALRNLMRSKLPVWLNVPQSYRTSKNELCGRDCELEGICWANVLGSSAQSGFKVVFQRVNKNEMINPSLNYYVSLLHKKVMGEKVYDTKILNGDSLSPKYFTHCTRNVSGSFSVMGVNFADYKTKISTKLAQKYTGSEIYQYVLNVDAGQILFNGVPVEINSDFQPIVKVKKPNRLTTFTLPPRSIGFWVFPLANLKQCSTKSDTEIVSPVQASIYNDFEHSSRTASEKLLHELIAEIVQMDSERNEVKRARRHAIVKKDSKHMNRNKRSADPGYKTRRAAQLLKKFNGDATKRNLPVIGLPRRRVTRQINNANLSNNRFSKLFKAFELPQPKKFTMAKFWNLSPPAQNTIPQNLAAIPPVTSTIHDIYRVDPSEQQIFKSVENSELPTGDVFYQVGEERNMDYVEFEDKADKFGKRLQQNKHPMESEKFVDFDVDDVQNVPDHMYEFYNEARDKKQAHPEMVPYTELWESDVYQKAPPPQNSQPIEQHRHFEEDSNNHEQNIDLIVKELPPTFRQNQENLMKAKSKLSAIYMNDGDRMSSTNIRLPMRHVDMDDDGFFVSKRKRRSISAGLNDEIENKLNNLKKAGNNNVGEELDDGYVDFLNKNGGKINLLEKITKIIESLEKIDDIGKYNNIEKLNSEIKELENFLFKRSSKFGLLKPKNRVTQKEIRRKCKILSVNLEQQCLKENDFYPSRLLSRDAKQTSDFKAMKMPPLKNAFPAKKSDNSNRVRRNAAYETSSSWEADDRANMIVKEMYSTNEFNDFVPSVSFKKTVRVADQPNEEKDEYIERVAVLQNLPESFSPNNVMQISAEQHRPVPTFSIDTGLDGRVIEKDIDNDQEAKEYQTPRFMKKISKSVQDWMNIVEKHVSGWWHIIS